MGGAGYGYDDSGNLTSDGEWTYSYDVENMLLTAASVTASASYIYDPMGRRSAKTVDGTLTTFLHDGVEEIADYNAAGTLLRRYVHGPGVDEYIVMYTGSGTANNRQYYHTNHQGSIVALSDDAGEMVETSAYTYSPYGMSEEEGVSGNPMRYTGRRLDAETGLYYYRARYYSPKVGRFLQTDPIGYGDGLNWYAYVGNSPLNNTDPFGFSRIQRNGRQYKLEYKAKQNEDGTYTITATSNGKAAGLLTVSTSEDGKTTTISGTITVKGSRTIGAEELNNYLNKANKIWGDTTVQDQGGHTFKSQITFKGERMTGLQTEPGEDEFGADRCGNYCDPTGNVLQAARGGQFLLSHGASYASEKVAAHEAGHTMGLSHNADPNSLMYYQDASGAQKLDWPELKLLACMYGGKQCD